ncbi:PDGLE domain-containing protein [Knoellia subterranea]|uniref:PDGLE domain-containing protein n=1 Tax=Knoellia subterranea TaxID=184882 RepID=UPI00068E7B23|nr:PDGLE domain-containing protein [Knoellia subterranea]
MTTAPRQPITTPRLVVAGLVVCVVLAAIVSFWASGHPDGLEFVAEKLGFIDSAGEHATGDSPLADYGVAGIDNARLSGGLAGLIGVVVVAAVAFGLMHLLRRRGTTDDQD